MSDHCGLGVIKSNKSPVGFISLQGRYSVMKRHFIVENTFENIETNQPADIRKANEVFVLNVWYNKKKLNFYKKIMHEHAIKHLKKPTKNILVETQ